MHRFERDTVAAVRRLDRALKHHDATLRRLRDSGGALEQEAFSLISKRVRRLQAELVAVDVDRLALTEGLQRLGVSFGQSDAAIGRALRRLLGIERNDRKKLRDDADAIPDPDSPGLAPL